MAWSHIRGHQRLVDAFAHAVARGRLAHAYLFTGPPGVGKTLFARELARALLCESPPADTVLTACDRCAACSLVTAGTHPDLFSIRRPEEKNELPIALMQELCTNFTLKTARGHGKVAIVEDADDLNEESANCFLKTLEEPPPRSVFVLIGTDVDQQLATIRSRCQVVRFAPLPADTVRDVLDAHGITDAALVTRLVRLAAGSPGQALALADEALWQCRRQLLEGLAARSPDSVGLARGLVEFAEDAGKELSLQRRRATLVLRLLVEALNDAINLSVGAAIRSCGPEEQPLLRALAERAGTEKIVAAIERCLDAEIQLGRYIQLGLVLEGLTDKVVHVLRAAPVSATGARSGPAESYVTAVLMRHTGFLFALLLGGCSTNPLVDTMDFFHPGKMYPNQVDPYGGVCGPQGAVLAPGIGPDCPVPPLPPGPGVVPGVVPPPVPLPGTPDAAPPPAFPLTKPGL